MKFIRVLKAGKNKLSLEDFKIYKDGSYYKVEKLTENAKNSGDSNVYFIDGSEMFNFPGGDECTVDGCHPTDLGFRIMADNVIKVMENILK